MHAISYLHAANALSGPCTVCAAQAVRQEQAATVALLRETEAEVSGVRADATAVEKEGFMLRAQLRDAEGSFKAEASKTSVLKRQVVELSSQLEVAGMAPLSTGDVRAEEQRASPIASTQVI